MLVGHTERLRTSFCFCVQARLPQCPCLFHENVGMRMATRSRPITGGMRHLKPPIPIVVISAVGEVAPVDIALFGRVKQVSPRTTMRTSQCTEDAQACTNVCDCVCVCRLARLCLR